MDKEYYEIFNKMCEEYANKTKWQRKYEKFLQYLPILNTVLLILSLIVSIVK